MRIMAALSDRSHVAGGFCPRLATEREFVVGEKRLDAHQGTLVTQSVNAAKNASCVTAINAHSKSTIEICIILSSYINSATSY